MGTLSSSALRTLGIGTLAVAGFAAGALAEPMSSGTPISFKLEILPILQNACVECHQPGGRGENASGLDLRSYEGLMKGTHNGPMVVAGSAFTSNLMVLLEGRASAKIRMPYHRQPLRKVYVELIRRWIDEGAKNN